MIEPGDLTHEVLAGYFGEHCECRPLDMERTSHSHDCDYDPCEDVLVALGGRPIGCVYRGTMKAMLHTQAAMYRIRDDIIEKDGDLLQLAALGRKLLGDAAKLAAPNPSEGKLTSHE